jgi:hypothetical protein
MRLHPTVWYMARTASRDDTFPLAFPITTKSGEQSIFLQPSSIGESDIALGGPTAEH